MRAVATIPAHLANAVADMHRAFEEFQMAQRRFVTVQKEYTEHDAYSSRMRIAAVDNLVKKGMTKTDAKDSPRLDPEYAAHGDKLTELANRKADAESELYTAKARLEVAIATVKAFTVGNGEIGQ